MAARAAGVRPGKRHPLLAALGSRTSFAMLAFGLASGLPFSLLIGTVTAWLGEAGVNLQTVGTLALAGLAYAYKFLWSPLIERVRLPLPGLGRRKGWIVAGQAAVIGCLLGLVLTDPASHIGRFGLFVILGAIASATQDIAINGWQIDAADEATPVELLASIYQLGYRTAAIIGGAFALHLAYTMAWPTVYGIMAGLMAALSVAGLVAPERTVDRQATTIAVGDAPPGVRIRALAITGTAWLAAIVAIAVFVAKVLDPGAAATSAASYLAWAGPAIVAATVLVPLAVAARVNRWAGAGAGLPGGASADHLYRALVLPFADLVARLGWGVLVVIGLILTYAICYNVWASFAYPFYLQELHYSKDQVAVASKVFGILMSMTGVALGGVLFVRWGRFPTVLLGAALPIAGNFLYADLAEGGAHLDAVAHAVHLRVLVDLLRLDRLGDPDAMARLLLAICYENISTGLAGAAFAAFVASIVSKRFAATQYALLSSLTFLIGSLGKSLVGEAIDEHGYAAVFRWVALAGLPAIGFVLAEWWRSSRLAPVREAGDTGLGG